MATNSGRYGSSAVRLAIHVPPTPSASSTSGPTQQSDAPMAAAVPAMSEVFALSLAILTLVDVSGLQGEFYAWSLCSRPAEALCRSCFLLSVKPTDVKSRYF